MATFTNLTLDVVRAYLGYGNGSPTDASKDLLLQLWLDAAIGLAQEITGRQLEKALYRDTLNYYPNEFYLREAPVASVVAMARGTGAVGLTEYSVFASSGRVQFNRGFGYRSMGYCGWGAEGFLTVDYVGGYTALPATLVMAVLTAIQAADQANKQMTSFGGIAKQITVVDVGSTTLATRPDYTSAAMAQTLSEHLSGFSDGLSSGVIGTPLLHETERIGDVPGSPE